MANFSDYMESGILQHFFRTGSFTKPVTLAIALCSGIPQDSNTGGNIPELPNANGYARWLIGPPSDAAFIVQDGLPSIAYNGSGITMFTNTSANIGAISGFAIVTSPTYGQGQVLMHGALATPQNMSVGNRFIWESGSMRIETR